MPAKTDRISIWTHRYQQITYGTLSLREEPLRTGLLPSLTLLSKCKTQMRIIAFIQDKHSIKDIMKAQGIPDFQAPPPIPKFIDAVEAIDELPSYDSFEPSTDDF